MSDALEVMKIGVEKVDQPGWQVETFLTRASDGLLLQSGKVGGLKWGQALSKRFQVEERYLGEGFERLPWKEEVLVDKFSDRKVLIKITWAGIPEQVEIDEIPF